MEVRVCIGEYCHLQGSEIVTRVFMELAEQERLGDDFDFKGVFCLGKCQEEGVSVRVGDVVHKVERENAQRFFREVVLPAVRPKA